MGNASTSSRQHLPVWNFPKLTTSVHEYRKSKSSSAKIRKHYAAILAFVYRNRFATANQVQRRLARFLKSDRTTRRHLAEMQALGFLETQPVNSISPLLPKIYFVTAKGRRFLKQSYAEKGMAWEPTAFDRRRSKGQSFVHVWHELAITEFLLSVWEFAESQSAVRLLIMERRSLYHHPAFEISWGRIVPDGLFLVHHPKGMILSLVEIDTGTESPRQLARKLENYQTWANSVPGQEFLCDQYRQAGAENPRPRFRLLFVIAPKILGSEASRIETFHDLMDEQPLRLGKRIWYTSTAQLRVTQPSELLQAPIWFWGSDPVVASASAAPSHAFFSL